MLINHKTKPGQAYSSIINELRKGSSDSRHPFRYLSLASFDKVKEESNIRMLVLREIREDHSIVLYTDARTSKVHELESLNNAALLFWHNHYKVQVTLKTEVEIHHQDDIAKHYWKSDVHGPAQKAYTPVVAPGTIIESPAEAHHWPDEYTDEYFCVLICIPYEIQILQLGGKEHFRMKFTRKDKEEEWKGEWIAP